jgi:hypothetical protein
MVAQDSQEYFGTLTVEIQAEVHTKGGYPAIVLPDIDVPPGYRATITFKAPEGYSISGYGIVRRGRGFPPKGYSEEDLSDFEWEPPPAAPQGAGEPKVVTLHDRNLEAGSFKYRMTFSNADDPNDKIEADPGVGNGGSHK